MNILPDDGESRMRAARAVAAGRVVAFRTDTFYGLGADPFNRDALERINELKGREGKPILVVIADAADAARLVSTDSEVFRLLAARHWPGPLTVVSDALPGVPEGLTAGTGTVGVRLPAAGDVRALLRACGGALTATSANPAGLAPARTAREAADYFGEEIALVIDGGATASTRPSTVVEARKSAARLIREGEVSAEELRRTLAGSGFDLLA